MLYMTSALALSFQLISPENTEIFIIRPEDKDE